MLQSLNEWIDKRRNPFPGRGRTFQQFSINTVRLWFQPLLVGSMLLLAFTAAAPAADPKGTGSSSTEGELVTAEVAFREVTLTGYTRPRYILDIVGEESGRCVKVNADVGNAVGEDGVFARLDTTFIDIEIKQNGVNQKQVQNRIAYLANEVKRHQELVERKAVAQAALDKYRNDLDQARIEFEVLKVQQANLEERRKRFAIRIPSGWKIIERHVEPGEWVSAGQNLGKAGDFNSLLVPFSLDSDEYRWLLAAKRKISLFLPDQEAGGIEVAAAVERVSPDFDPQTRKINVDLIVSKSVPEKRGGIRTQLTLQLPDPSGAVQVPTAALEKRYEVFWLTRPDGERVKVVLLGDDKNGTCRVCSPEVRPGDSFQIKSGS